ncbi:MAG: penicillin-binding protein [Bacteroidota bacterium]|nr:penicillin-binding protein [Bacteroidota bacterium]
MESNRAVILYRIGVVYIVVILTALVIIGRVLYIQFGEGNELKIKAEKLNLRYDNIEAMRGNILSSDGSLLATSVPIFEIRMDVASENITDNIFAKNVDTLSLCLSHLFNDKSATEYRKLLTQARAESNRYLLLRRDVTYDELKKLRTFPIFRMGKYKGGLIAIARNKRINPFKELAFRTIGWEREGNNNNVGIEGTFTNVLAGMSGKRLMQRLGNGSWRPINSENEIEPENGADIVTTINTDIQDVAESALQRELIASDADHGCAILMEVKTGAIKAIANLGKMSDGTFVEKYNYAIAESSEPGSTFKLASMLVALEDKVTDLDRWVSTGNGSFNYANRVMHDSHGGHGTITVKQAFEISSNVGISQVIYNAYWNKPQKYIDGLYALGINKTTGIEIRGEGMPRIKNTRSRSWSKVSLPWMSIGYEVAVTPLQTLALYNAVANNGCMVRPMLIKEIRKSNQPVKVFEPVVINPAIASKITIAKAHKLLEGVVEEGTAKNVKCSVFKIAGKTGTAQIAMNDNGYNKENYKASFVGYYPADNPQYSCIVVINNPSKGLFYGGSVAAPVFLDIAQKVYATSPDLHKRKNDSIQVKSSPKLLAGNRNDLQQICNVLGLSNNSDKVEDEWIKGKSNNSSYSFSSVTPKVGVVPDVSGMGIRDAVYLLEKAGYKVQFTGKGKVYKQSIEPGVFVNRGTLINLELSQKHLKQNIENNKSPKNESLEKA